MSKEKRKIIIDHFADRLRYIATVRNRLYHWKEEEVKIYRQMNKIQIISAYEAGLGDVDNASELAEKWFNRIYEY